MQTNQDTHIHLLKDKTFISTRPSGKSAGLKKLLTAEGAQMLELPMIEVVPAILDEDEKQHLQQMHSFDWVILTSANAVHFFMETGNMFPDFPKALENLHFAVIGEKTAAALHKYGLIYHFLSHKANGESLVSGLGPILKKDGAKILYRTSNISNGFIPDALDTLANVYKIAMYNTKAPASFDQSIVDRIIDDAYNIMFFFSPSAFNNFHTCLKDTVQMNKIHVASIGPTTHKAIVEYGISPVFMAEEQSETGLFQSTMRYYQSI